MSEQASPSRPETRRDPTLLDLFPTPEDWVAIQGGKPRVFRQPDKPRAPWIVLHVYDENPDHDHRFVSGLVVDTLPDRTNQVVRLAFTRSDDEGKAVDRDIVIPSFMYRKDHGDHCDARSAGARGEGYERIRFQPKYEEFIDKMIREGYEELRFGATPDELRMQPLPQIRPPKPLAE